MFFFLIVVIILASALYIFLQRPAFGALPVGERLKKVQQSPHYRDNKFQNIHHTPDLTEGTTYYSVLKEFLFEKKLRKRPSEPLPSKKTDLLALNPADNLLVWFGHSSYFLQVDGKKILTDPVFSGNASPLSFTTKSFAGSDVYTVEDLPVIDYLFISHDHWDHLDYPTVLQLRAKVGKVICGLGVGQHLEKWGFDTNIIIEKDWDQVVTLDPGFELHTFTARHFSGRSFKRNTSLWMSASITTPARKIYLGGDSGYDTHFKTIGEAYGPFDLAILECGQYDKSWKYIHMQPEETVQAAIDLGAKKLMPVHWAKFSLGNHTWDDPIIRVFAAAQQQGLPLQTPLIGEAVNLDIDRQFAAWWKTID